MMNRIDEIVDRYLTEMQVGYADIRKIDDLASEDLSGGAYMAAKLLNKVTNGLFKKQEKILKDVAKQHDKEGSISNQLFKKREDAIYDIMNGAEEHMDTKTAQRFVSALEH